MIKLSDGVIFCLPILTALLLWLGFPGGGEAWPVLAFAFIPLLYLVQYSNPRSRFFYGLLGGFCHFMLLLYWIVIVLGKYGGLPWFFSYPALCLLALYMATFVGIFALISGAFLKKRNANISLWMIPALWVGLDWLRSFLFSGFPWMDPGYALWQVPALIQMADVVGHHGVTFMILQVNVFLLLVLKRTVVKSQKVQILVTIVTVLTVVVGYGQYRRGQLQEIIAANDAVTIGIVQGNIEQSSKWTPAIRQTTVNTYLTNTKTLSTLPEPPELVVWPETALPFFPSTNPLMGTLRYMTSENDVALLTGSPWFERRSQSGVRKIKFYNSAFVLQQDGEYGGFYYKSHLVPFGEYVPLKKFLFFLAPLVEAVGDFTPGKVESPLVSGKIKSGVLICFESIFPDIARRWVGVGANVLVNLTNDAWYGKSSAPSHSMAMSVFRAVETRRSLVRAANTGISGFVDPLGQVQASSEIFTLWAKSMKVTLMDEVSLYTRFGYLFAPFCFFVSFLMVVISIAIRKK